MNKEAEIRENESLMHFFNSEPNAFQLTSTFLYPVCAKFRSVKQKFIEFALVISDPSCVK